VPPEAVGDGPEQPGDGEREERGAGGVLDSDQRGRERRRDGGGGQDGPGAEAAMLVAGRVGWACHQVGRGRCGDENGGSERAHPTMWSDRTVENGQGTV